MSNQNNTKTKKTNVNNNSRLQELKNLARKFNVQIKVGDEELGSVIWGMTVPTSTSTENVFAIRTHGYGESLVEGTQDGCSSFISAAIKLSWLRANRRNNNKVKNHHGNNERVYKVVEGREEVEARIGVLYNAALAFAKGGENKKAIWNCINQMSYLAEQVRVDIRDKIDCIWDKAPSNMVPFEMLVPDNNLDWNLMIVRLLKGIGPYYQIVYKNGSQKVIAKGRKAACERCIKSCKRRQDRDAARKKAEEEERQARLEAEARALQLLEHAGERLLNGEPFIGEIQALIKEVINEVHLYNLDGDLIPSVQKFLDNSILSFSKGDLAKVAVAS